MTAGHALAYSTPYTMIAPGGVKGILSDLLTCGRDQNKNQPLYGPRVRPLVFEQADRKIIVLCRVGARLAGSTLPRCNRLENQIPQLKMTDQLDPSSETEERQYHNKSCQRKTITRVGIPQLRGPSCAGT